MSVISVVEHFDQRGGEEKIDKGQRLHTRTFEVTCNSKSDDEVTVLAAGALPVAGVSFHPNDPWAICTSVSGKQKAMSKSGGVLWHVVATYDTQWDTTQLDTDPLTRNPKVSGKTEIYDLPVVVDLTIPTPKKVLNSAGMTFADPPTRKAARHTITMTWNKDWNTFNMKGHIDALQNTTNETTWWGYDAGTCWLKDISWQVMKEGAVKFYQITYQVEIYSEGIKFHPFKVLDTGFEEISGLGDDGFSTIPILNQDGTKREKPSLLDGSGFKLHTSAAPFWLQFRFFRSASWSSLPNPDLA